MKSAPSGAAFLSASSGAFSKAEFWLLRNAVIVKTVAGRA